MHADVSRLVGIEGMVVTGVADHGWWLELEVEMRARAGCCRWCGRGSLQVKERDRVRVRDLPFAGRTTYLCWRKRRFWCEACARTFTDFIRRCRRASASAPGFASICLTVAKAAARMLRSRGMSAPAATRSRRRSCSAATSCSPAASTGHRVACRSTRRTIATAESSRPSSPTSIAVA